MCLVHKNLGGVKDRTEWRRWGRDLDGGQFSRDSGCSSGDIFSRGTHLDGLRVCRWVYTQGMVCWGEWDKERKRKKKEDHITSLFIATDSGDDGRHVDPAHTTTQWVPECFLRGWLMSPARFFDFPSLENSLFFWGVVLLNNCNWEHRV